MSPHIAGIAPAGVSLSDVGRAFGAHVVLRDIDLEVAPGEVVALLGASGCGKSTLLRLVGGLDHATSGSVKVDGAEVTGIDPRCAVVFQEPRLLPWRTLAANVALGLPRDLPRSERAAQARHWLGVVELERFEGHRPRQVSGGMAQRTALARALARRPGVLLLDEPFAALDALTRLRMQNLVEEVQRRAGTTILLVTHDVDEALRLADRIVLLAAEPGGAPGTTVAATVHVPGELDPADAALLRDDLLTRLGVPQRTTPAPKETVV
ncbi:ABC transporter [Microtetraspora sp. NBRC 13810]|uniref:ABC transporter ATP-binding protein n=1 Tax=Microtetraspora sp. NBRC 13810 TaxID=3030990 RepID=UPI0024A23F4F|nr:ABC transporter ATP-binding protein [Microtetraspora sp. NBRC 13810]GLW05933.1 ABC transporter [Microtetraspora sp. NBRC 13810]